MRTKAILVIFLLASGLAAENLEKAQKKELEAEVKAMTAEAQQLERTGQLAEARIKYAESQALIEMKDVTDALKHLDEEIHKRVKDALGDSRKLYELHNFKEAAAALEESMKLQAFPPVLAYNLALCYYQLGERKQSSRIPGKGQSGHGGSERMTYKPRGEGARATQAYATILIPSIQKFHPMHPEAD
jgi:tetratricopeptide (TPR) repeat protein